MTHWIARIFRPGRASRRLEEWIAEFDAEVSRLKSENAALHAETIRLKNEAAALRAENARLATEATDLKEERARLWSELMTRNRQLEQEAAEKVVALREQEAAERIAKVAAERESELLSALLPDVDFIRDSQEVLMRRLKSRLPALRLLRELSWQRDRIKGERVESTAGWKELRFKTGERDNGRIYFRERGGRCAVLVSLKNDQKADIRYLQGL